VVNKDSISSALEKLIGWDRWGVIHFAHQNCFSLEERKFSVFTFSNLIFF